MDRPDTCEWKYDDSNFDWPVWVTSCGEEFTVGDFELKELNINYCQHCGGKVQQPTGDR